MPGNDMTDLVTEDEEAAHIGQRKRGERAFFVERNMP